MTNGFSVNVGVVLLARICEKHEVMVRLYAVTVKHADSQVLATVFAFGRSETPDVNPSINFFFSPRVLNSV